MAKTTELKFDTRELDRAITRLSVLIQQDTETVLKQVAKGIVQTAINLTPPGSDSGGGDNGDEARSVRRSRRAGQIKVESDIRKVLTASPRSKATHSDVAAIHRRHRSRTTGRTRKPRKVYRVSKAELTAYIRQKKAKVGYLAGGWTKAAQKLGVKLPQWISGQGTPGSVYVKVTRNQIHIIATNAAGFASNVRNLERRVGWAVKNQTSNLRTRIAFAMERAGRRSGFRR